jgi:MbtH protein
MSEDPANADNRTYIVVLNDEEQYSVWWQGRDLPAGWRVEGTAGSRAACLDRIERIWTDMTPRSVRDFGN